MKTVFCVVLLAATGLAAPAGATDPVAAPAVAAAAFDGWTLRPALPADASQEDQAAGRKGTDPQRAAHWSDPSPARIR